MVKTDDYDALLIEASKLAYFCMGLAAQSRGSPKGVNHNSFNASRLRNIRRDIKLVLDQCPLIMDAVTRQAVLKLVQDGKATVDGDIVTLTRPARNQLCN